MSEGTNLDSSQQSRWPGAGVVTAVCCDPTHSFSKRVVDEIRLLAGLGTALHVGDQTIVEVTGLRNPCGQLDAFQDGLMAAVLDRDADGQLIRKAGIMGVVRCGGTIRSGDLIRIVLPPPPHRPLDRV